MSYDYYHPKFKISAKTTFAEIIEAMTNNLITYMDFLLQIEHRQRLIKAWDNEIITSKH